ncbi:aminotransferase class V-fold PLP-dependent enzyme [Kordiimonas sp.]|uniref:aminotransferase class V-fold PLP-dependent enzyme n=1 Tax=Kordiimonas sp. TaxID=1970157 RepID=UPI003A8ECC54
MKSGLHDFIAHDPNGGILELFSGRHTRFSFNTRVAIRKACDLLGLAPGDEVLAPAYNCGSELDPLRHAGLSIRLYPVDRRTHIDLDAIERMIGPRTHAVYLTHYFGFLQPDATALRDLCDRHGLWLIEDCALSLLSGAQPVEGRTGDVAVFCFYKFFPTLGGGALVINNERFTMDIRFDGQVPSRQMLKHVLRMGLAMTLGAERSATLLRYIRRGRALDTLPLVIPSGPPDMPPHYYFDPRLQDASISLFAARPLRAFNVAKTVAARRRNYRAYLKALSDMPGVSPLFPELPEDVCPLSMPVLTDNRDALAAALVARGIPATPWWSGYNRHLDWTGCEDACHLKDHVLSLPLHQYLETEAVMHITKELNTLLKAR